MDTSGEAKPNIRLDGWGEIASYLKKDIRTVQRWEKMYPDLPIHRAGSPKPKVWAFTGELDDWWRKQDALATEASSSEQQQFVPRPSQPDVTVQSTRAVLVFFGALLCAVSVAVIASSRLPSPKLQFQIADRIFARVDAESGSTKFIPVEGSPTQMLLSPSGDEIFLLSADGTHIQVLDLSSLSGNDKISVPGIFSPVAVAPDGNTLYVGTTSGELRIIDRKRKNSRVADRYPAFAHWHFREMESSYI